MPVLKNKDGRYTVLFYDEVDIDGFHCRDEFVELISSTGSKAFYDRAHEWCCGHGAIGFKVLESQLCGSLVLTDKYAPATVGCDFTATLNDIQDRVTIYQSSDFSTIPFEEKWDLMIANPPWRSIFRPGPEVGADLMRKMWDIGWNTHRNMYANVGKYLTHDADFYIYEDSRFSNSDTWKEMLDTAGLYIKDIYSKFGVADTGYVMHLKKQ